MKEWQLVKQTEANWSADRPTIEANNTLYNISEALRGEVMEMVIALAWYLIDPTDERKKEVLQESADVGIYLMAIFRLLDSDMMDEFMEKIAFNSSRYLAKDFQEGDYKETYKRRKKELKEEGWKDTFYGS